VLGVIPDWGYRDFNVPLLAGDRLLFYTDGLTEAANAQDEEFGTERIIQSVKKDGLTPAAKETQRELMDAVSSVPPTSGTTLPCLSPSCANAARRS
jgi:sigma-B regulation protein RsbU (phosphoserine phosphatase)